MASRVNPKSKTPVQIQQLLLTIIDQFDNEDSSVRQRQITEAKRLKYLWEGFTRLWYSEVAHDWRVWDEQLLANSDQNEDYYDKPMNIFKAYLESIFAALSIVVPPLNCTPDDSDNPLDVATAKAGNSICELVYKHVDAPLLWLHSLYIIGTEHLCATYNYTKFDKKYGTYEEHEHQDIGEDSYVCESCGNNVPDEEFEAREINEFMPDESDAILHNLLMNEDAVICPTCMAALDPNLQKTTNIVTRLIGTKELPKGRQCVEFYGSLDVKVPNYAKTQDRMPYLMLFQDIHYTETIEQFPDIGEMIGDGYRITSGPPTQDGGVEFWGRTSTQYRGDYPVNMTVKKQVWLRPFSYNCLPEEDSKKLKRRYPDGCKVTVINDNIFACAENENLDDCWTVMKQPMSDYLFCQPMGQGLVPVQEITNDLVSLTLQTIEHGIGQTFVDPAVLNLDAYGQTQVTPGAVYATKASYGKKIGDGFYELKTAQLSSEVMPFGEKVQEMGQLISGALPAIFGGQLEGNKTASGYSMSRAQALQRLQNTWKMLTTHWKTVFSKVVTSYIKNCVDDEKFTKRNKFGSFITTFIRQSDLEGKIGDIELEANENLPLTWSQKKDVIMALMQSTNPAILEALGSPENLPEIRDSIGLTDFLLPGESDREKQYEEIQILINSEPMTLPVPDQLTGQMIGEQEVSSVEVDPLVDNHPIEAEICRIYLIGEAGRQLKASNPAGYKNVMLHMKEHLQMIPPPMAPTDGAGEPNMAKTKGTSDIAPKGQDNVATAG